MPVQPMVMDGNLVDYKVTNMTIVDSKLQLDDPLIANLPTTVANFSDEFFNCGSETKGEKYTLSYKERTGYSYKVSRGVSNTSKTSVGVSIGNKSISAKGIREWTKQVDITKAETQNSENQITQTLVFDITVPANSKLLYNIQIEQYSYRLPFSGYIKVKANVIAVYRAIHPQWKFPSINVLEVTINDINMVLPLSGEQTGYTEISQRRKRETKPIEEGECGDIVNESSVEFPVVFLKGEETFHFEPGATINNFETTEGTVDLLGFLKNGLVVRHSKTAPDLIETEYEVFFRGHFNLTKSKSDFENRKIFVPSTRPLFSEPTNPWELIPDVTLFRPQSDIICYIGPCDLPLNGYREICYEECDEYDEEGNCISYSCSDCNFEYDSVCEPSEPPVGKVKQ